MRLGVVMTGHGAHAAACVGVLRELKRRGIDPCGVCGMHAGAWPAALFASGLSMESMEKALHQAAGMGRRMIAPKWDERMIHTDMRMSKGYRLERLLVAQTGERILSLCPEAAIFPLRMLRTGQRVVFSTRAYMQLDDAMLAMQASIGFAARAAMGFAPFLAPLQYMGSALVSETDIGFACRQLIQLNAQRVLVIRPYASPNRVPDALELAAGMLDMAAMQQPLDRETGVLRIRIPESAGALSLDRLAECMYAGECTAQQELDRLLDQMGMARCRVLPFRRSLP